MARMSKLNKFLLGALLCVFLCTNIIAIATMISHACCQVEQCVPCIYVAFLYDGMQYGAAMVVASAAVLACLYVPASSRCTQRFSSLVELKTRMNN
jgi:hypothetical protein